ncbi:MAG TPA: hypothetical protein VEM93_00845 [Actinomycetota bacterium]|nr:hypothetical protein [Actinomycetota bacterium]
MRICTAPLLAHIHANADGYGVIAAAFDEVSRTTRVRSDPPGGLRSPVRYRQAEDHVRRPPPCTE